MASNIDSFINLRSTGTSGSLTHYADGRFLSVWTDFDKDGGAYVYGKLFNADGTAAGNHFLIDYAVEAFYREITAETLTDGRTVIAWVKSDSSGASVVGKVLSTSFMPSGELLILSPNAVSEEAPELHALDEGAFAVLYRGSATFDGQPFTGLIAHFLTSVGAGWTTKYHLGLNDLPDDNSNDTTVLADGTCVVAASFPAEDGSSRTDVALFILKDNGDWDSFVIDEVPGVSSGINPATGAMGATGFVIAWEDVEGQTRVIRAQMVDKTGTSIGTAISFEKPDGTLKGTPVIKQLANGGFAIAFVVETNGDKNLYTATANANGEVTLQTTIVGTNTAGDQWDPSITELSGGTYAVSWLSNGESGLSYQYIVEVIGREGTDVVTPITPGGVGEPPPPPPPPPSGSAWTGTGGNDAHTGTSVSEVLKGLGGKDIIDGAGGNDKIWGGLGNDSLKGGDGLDIFVFDTKPNKSSNKDKIADFKVSDDSIWLDNKVFTKLGKAGTETKPAQMKKDFFTVGSKAKDKNDYLVYDNKKGVLSYDADGSGTKYKAVEIATLTKNLKMTHKDFFII